MPIAKIIQTNTEQGLYAGLMANGLCVIFETSDHHTLKRNDVIFHHHNYKIGNQIIENMTQHYAFAVTIQNICSQSLVNRQCLIQNEVV